LESVDATIEALLRAAVPLSATDVDVTFEAPTRDWSAKLTRPTVNLYLWDIHRSRTHARAGVERFESNGAMRSRLALPRVELRYFATVWASEHRDERSLLGGLLRAALSYSSVPETFVAAPLRDLSPVQLSVAMVGEQGPEMGKTLDGQIKPGFELMAVSDVDIGLSELLAPPVTSFEVNVADRLVESRRSELRRIAGEVLAPDAVGRRVSSPRGGTVVNEAGRFLIAAAPGDEIVVGLDPPRSAIVPEHGGVVIS
jgi:hypothetical protein